MPIEYTIKQGDTIAKIAFKHGMKKEKIWDDPANSDLKNNFEDTNILSPGKVLTIPDIETKEESIQTGSSYKFCKKIGSTKLKIKLQEDGEARSNVEYILEIDGKTKKGKTDKDGLLEEEIPVNAKKGVINIGDEETIQLQLGTLDPVTDLSGVQQRLNNLGYDCGGTDGKVNEQTKAAIRGFQETNKLNVTGDPDKVTQDKLVEIHGS